MTQNNEQWANDPAARGQAWRALRDSMAARGVLSLAEAAHDKPWDLKAVKDVADAVALRMAEAPSQDAWVAAVLGKAEVMYPEPAGVVTWTVSLALRPGLTLTAAAPFDDFVTEVDAVRAMIARAERLGEDLGYDLVAAVAPVMPGASSEKQYEVVAAETVVHDFSGGKHAYKVKGGKYAQFGVRVWPEVLMQTGLEFDLGETEVSGTMRVEMKDGKPYKVVALAIEAGG